MIIVVYKGRNWQLFNDSVAEYLTSLFGRAGSKGRAPASGSNRFPTYSKYITSVKIESKGEPCILPSSTMLIKRTIWASFQANSITFESFEVAP